MRAWNEQEIYPHGASNRRLQELSGVGTADSDSDGDSLAPKRRGRSARDAGKGKSEQTGGASTPDAQFVGDKCKDCLHPKTMHFIESDSLGAFMFCMFSICECFKDWSKNASS